MIDLSKYSIFPKINSQKSIIHNQKEDYENVEVFNKSMLEVRQEYFSKEKLSFESAKNAIVD